MRWISSKCRQERKIHANKHLSKGKVKEGPVQAFYRAREFQTSRHLICEGGKVIKPTHQLPLSPSVAKRIMSMKTPVTPLRIELVNF
jgi:hypothetical protein